MRANLFRRGGPEFMPRQPITREVIAFMSDRGYELYDITEYLRRRLTER
jgi:hypothetical protein